MPNTILTQTQEALAQMAPVLDPAQAKAALWLAQAEDQAEALGLDQDWLALARQAILYG